MKITYYHTLYKRLVTDIVAGDITFMDGKVYFSSKGHGCCIEVEYVVSIEKGENL